MGKRWIKIKKLKYKDFFTIIRFHEEDKIFYGKIENVEDSVNFHANTLDDIEKEFHLAVDNYIEMCAFYDKEIKLCF